MKRANELEYIKLKEEIITEPSVVATPSVSKPKKKKKKNKPLPDINDILEPSFRKSSRKKVAVTQLNFMNFEMKRNNDYCECCNGSGTFLCCDSCPRSFHFTCLDPPLDPNNVPDDDWYCRACKPLPLPKGFSTKGVFGNLLEIINRKNPSSFNIPDEIKNEFEGVGTNYYGEYVDTSILKNPKQRVGPAQTDINDFKKMRDKNNNIIICYKCHKSALSGPIVGCDYCPLFWHMDCVTPPMTVPPQSHLKWKCPIHADHITPKVRKLKPKPLENGSVVSKLRSNGINGSANCEEINEKEIAIRFFAKVAENKKLARFQQIKKTMEHETLSKLTDPRINVQNQLDVMQTIGGFNCKPGNQISSFPQPNNSSDILLKENNRKKFKKFLKEINFVQKEGDNVPLTTSILGVQSETLTKPFVKVPRPMFRQLNSVRQLIGSINQKKLLNFLIENSKDQSND